ncbi:MAG: HAD-IA family hydrolase [Isosphaeraceae bacterium]
MADRALLLDLDGTIADTLPLIFDAFRHAIAPWVDAMPDDDAIEATFGPPERGCIAMLAPSADLDESERRFFEYYEKGHRDAVRLFDGIAGLIDRVKGRGWKVAVVTGKSRRAAEFSLKELDLWHHLDLLVSNDELSKGKPDPEGIRLASSKMGIPTSRLLMVGDMPADVEAGRAAGAATAAATWAAFRPELLRQAGADFVCDSVEELLAVIDRWSTNR